MRNTNLAYQKNKTEIDQEFDIIKQAIKDPRAFAPIYDDYYQRIFLFLLKRSGNETLAEDLCSQTFLKALKNLAKYKNQGVPFSAWLYRIAYNEFLLHQRSEKYKRAVYAKSQDFDIFFDEREEMEINEERKHKAKMALQQLNEDELFLIELKYFEHRQYTEIADITGLSVSNAKVKMHRIIKKLNKLVNHE